MVRSKLLGGLGVGLLAFAIAGCGSSSSGGGSGGSSGSTSCTPGGTTVCVEPDPTNVGKFNPASVSVATGGSVTWNQVGMDSPRGLSERLLPRIRTDNFNLLAFHQCFASPWPSPWPALWWLSFRKKYSYVQ